MEHLNQETPDQNAATETVEPANRPQSAETATQDLPAAPSSKRLMTFAQNATEQEKIIMEQMASTRREPRITPIGKKHSLWQGIVMILLCVPVLAFGIFVYIGAMPLLVAGSAMLVLMGVWRIVNRKKRPCVCPYCANFDDIKDEVIEYQCPRCEERSVRVGDELHPQKAPSEG